MANPKTKRKVMSAIPMSDVVLDGENVEIVNDLICLCSIIERFKYKIIRRYTLGRAAMAGLYKRDMKGRDITTATKCIIVNPLVFHVVLPVSEYWTIGKKRER